jgi:hypothetical protein
MLLQTPLFSRWSLPLNICLITLILQSFPALYCTMFIELIFSICFINRTGVERTRYNNRRGTLFCSRLYWIHPPLNDHSMADIQRRRSILAWIVIFCLFTAQTQLQESSYLSLPLCADLLIYEINYWVLNHSNLLRTIIYTSLIINLQ